MSNLSHDLVFKLHNTVHSEHNQHHCSKHPRKVIDRHTHITDFDVFDFY
jgi:hypothetical protein